MKKKILSVIMIATMAVSLVACGKASNTVDSIEKQDAETQEVDVTEVISTIESTENVVENAIEESTEDVAEEVAESETEVITEESAEETESESEDSPAYTFVDMDAIKYAKSNVNVRNLPDKSGEKLGGLSTNDEVKVTGQCNETGWYRIEYNGSEVYVSDSYLVSEKVVEQLKQNIPDNGGNNTAGTDTTTYTGELEYRNYKTAEESINHAISLGYTFNTYFQVSDKEYFWYDIFFWPTGEHVYGESQSDKIIDEYMQKNGSFPGGSGYSNQDDAIQVLGYQEGHGSWYVRKNHYVIN